MSLASLLLNGSQTSSSKSSQSIVVDNELDTLFRSNLAPPAVTPIQTAYPEPSDPSSSKTSHKPVLKRKRPEQAGSKHSVTTSAVLVEPRVSKVSKRRRPTTVAEFETEDASGDDTDNDAWLEDSYFSRRTTQKYVAAPETAYASASESSSRTDDENAPLPPHETHGKLGPSKTRSKAQKKVRYAPSDESPGQRDARTIFVGNVPVAVVKSKSLQKQLKRHFLSLIHGSKIESIRFRSVAFASATTALPKEDTLSTKQQRQQDRAAQWRESASTKIKITGKELRDHDDETSEREDSNGKTKKASYLSPTERKRIAFIKGKFHKAVDTVNAYIVFAYDKASQGSETPAGMVTQLYPFEAARLAVERCDGTLFMDRTIRVDRVGQWRAGSGELTVGNDMGGLDDPRATLFVGNLDFAAKEEDLRVWFEGVVSQERGSPPEEGEDGSENDGTGGMQIPREKRRGWVRSVRIVRDRDSQLGKGFAYVRFLDRDCVDEILGLELAKLKFAKRKLRVQRCKAVLRSIGSPTEHRTMSVAPPRPKQSATTASTVPLPKGDPSLGEKLAGLSKDERKAAKAANADRIKRRLAKKKIKEGLQKAQGTKERRRERTQLKKSKSDRSAKVVHKGRVRSEKSMAKRNAKK